MNQERDALKEEPLLVVVDILVTIHNSFTLPVAMRKTLRSFITFNWLYYSVL